jgi:hypothetical protein
MRVLQVALWITISIITIYAPLKVFDLMMASRSGNNLAIDTHNGSIGIQTHDLYPYEGWHMQPDFHHLGEAPWESTAKPGQVFDIKTGDRGFFIDFRLNAPPKKAADEFRIVLIGGSGGQGWGATSNARMLYRQIPEFMNREGRYKKKITLINLAMASQHTYQSFITLNRYGHELQPDLILCYCGRNDLVVPVHHEKNTDGFMLFSELNTLALATRPSVVPPILSAVHALFPNIMDKTNIGTGLKIALGYKYLKEYALSHYKKVTNQNYSNPNETIDKLAIPMFVDAIKSIKRDFMGIPIVIAWQAIDDSERKRHYAAGLRDGFYEEAFQRVIREVNGYMNNSWYFVDVNSSVRGRTYGIFAVLLDDNGHRVVSKIIAEKIREFNVVDHCCPR